jgi:hypothetical protein
MSIESDLEQWLPEAGEQPTGNRYFKVSFRQLGTLKTCFYAAKPIAKNPDFYHLYEHNGIGLDQYKKYIGVLEPKKRALFIAGLPRKFLFKKYELIEVDFNLEEIQTAYKKRKAREAKNAEKK